MLRKMSLFALVVGFASLNAFAGNDGPQGDIAEPPRVVAQLRMSGIFFWGPMRSQGVRVFSDGQVITFEQALGVAETAELLTTLSPEKLEKLVVKVEGTVPSELYDPNPTQPECMDAPMTVYTVFQASGAKIDVGQTHLCHEYYMRNGQGVQLRNALDGLWLLAGSVRNVNTDYFRFH